MATGILPLAKYRPSMDIMATGILPLAKYRPSMDIMATGILPYVQDERYVAGAWMRRSDLAKYRPSMDINVLYESVGNRRETTAWIPLRSLRLCV